MEEKKKYVITISCGIELEADNADEAKDMAVKLFELGPQIITSVKCEEIK